MDQEKNVSASPGASRHQASTGSDGDRSAASSFELQTRLSAAELENSRLRAALLEAEARERALSVELQHRARNMLAVIHNILRRTRDSSASQEQFADHFEGRLRAIGRYQYRYEGRLSPGIELEEIVRGELLEVCCSDGPGCTIEGPDVRLDRKTAEMLGLAIHELTTNSVKFGALAQDGTLKVRWSRSDEGDGPVLRFVWTETGLSPVAPAPRPTGFGRQLIEEGLPYQLGATVTFDLKPGGVECSIRLPLPGFEDENLDRAAEHWLLPASSGSAPP